MAIAKHQQYKGTIAPSFSDKITNLEKARLFVRIKKASLLLLGGAVIALIGWVLSKLITGWVLYVGLAFGGLIIIFAINALLAGKTGKCPYCDGIIGEGDDDVSSNDENETIECPSCHELLISHQGAIRAFGPADAEGKTEFTVSVFKDGVWPGECLVCGAPAERTEDAASIGLNATELLVGRLSVSTGSIKNIPYCKNHSKAVRLKAKKDALKLIFSDLGALRRYVAVNRGKPAVK
ncbi:MAG TPA: hypothetical protein VF857_09795 [Spirochaetota bacterium]